MSESRQSETPRTDAHEHDRLTWANITKFKCDVTKALAEPKTWPQFARKLERENQRLREQVATIRFPMLIAGNAAAIAYEMEQGGNASVTTTLETKVKWLRDLSMQLTAFDKLNTP